tara:strand:- start:224 stop:1030 length:807 start_codon:yes stop_codon:yes gene_type:complete
MFVNMSLFSSLLVNLYANRVLAFEMAKRDLYSLNKGAFLGAFWLVIRPLIQVAVYVTLVSIIFNVSTGEDSGPFDYAMYVLAGMPPWQVLTKAFEEAPSLIRGRLELVKQVIYPIETLPLTAMAIGSVGALINILVLFLLMGFSGELRWAVLLLPIPIVITMGFAVGVSWIAMVAGIIIKDLREIVSVVLGLLVYLSPVVVKEEMVSERVWGFIEYNPLTHFVLIFRDPLEGTFHGLSYVIAVLLAISSLLIGGFVITKTKLKINEHI